MLHGWIASHIFIFISGVQLFTCTNDCKPYFFFFFGECPVRMCEHSLIERSEGMDRWSWSDAPHKNPLVMRATFSRYQFMISIVVMSPKLSNGGLGSHVVHQARWKYLKLKSCAHEGPVPIKWKVVACRTYDTKDPTTASEIHGRHNIIHILQRAII